MRLKPTLKDVNLWVTVLGLLITSSVALAAIDNGSQFYLKDGDRVCFYGDSITEQRYYGMDVETYVRTRFPHLHVKFVNSGVGGDRVTGGWAGGIDLRLERDVFPFKPNVVTIMLGMNDAEYRPFDQNVFSIYTNGYEHIVESLQQHLPWVHIVLIEPSPYDDITEAPGFAGGYNGVLLRYSAFVRQLATKHHLTCVDLNLPLVEVMKKSQAENPKLAREVIPGRVHPSAAGELVMAQGILKAWNAPETVTSISIDAAGNSVNLAENTSVSDLKIAYGVLSWTQNDRCLPFPILALHDDWPQFPPVERDGGSLTFFNPAPEVNWNYTNASTAMIVQDSGFYQALDQEQLQVTSLQPGNYRLKIDGRTVGEFSAEKLDAGVNLAQYRTPMLERSYRVLHLVWQEVEWRYFAWRGIQNQLWFDRNPAVQKATKSLMAALEAQKESIVKQQYDAARPHAMRYELALITSTNRPASDRVTMPSVPDGLQALGGYGLIGLNWKPSLGATSYTVKRSTRSGEETTIATVTSTNYIDRDLANGTAYYYFVSSGNLHGQSGNSTEVKVTPKAPKPGSYAAAIMADHPLAYWPLDQTNCPIAFDPAGGHNGTYVGGVTIAQPDVPAMGYASPSCAAHFDGTSGYVDVPGGSFNITNGFTLVSWINVSVMPANFSGIVGHGDSSWRMTVNTLGWPGASDGDNEDATSPISIQGGGWHMISYSYTGAPDAAGNGSLYLDGAPVACNTISQLSGNRNGYDVWIGGSPDYGKNRLFAGYIDRVAVFNRALSDNQILSLFRVGSLKSL